MDERTKQVTLFRFPLAGSIKMKRRRNVNFTVGEIGVDETGVGKWEVK